MTDLAYYLFKVILCSGVLFLYYHVALRNKAFHQWNRFYLLAAVLLSLLLPLVQFTVLLHPDQQHKTILFLQALQSADNTLAEFVVVSRSGASPEQWMMISYALVGCMILLGFLVSLFRIVSIIRSHTAQRLRNIHFISTNLAGTPFSFWNYIVWNEAIPVQSPSGQQIFQHELVHVREKHTLDKLFLQLVLVPFWCNPFFWLIRRELSLVHEFIADKKAVNDHGEAAFASMILQAAYPQQFYSLTNPFFQNSIKRRLAMLKKIQNPTLNYLSRIVALPLVAFTVFAFTVRTESAQSEQPSLVIQNTAGKISTHFSSLSPLVNDTPPPKLSIQSVDVNKQKNQITITYTDGSSETLTEQEAAKRGLIHNGGFGNQKNNASSPKQDSELVVKGGAANPLFFVDGKETDEATVSRLNPGSIEAINVLKDKTAIDKYGMKGKNGVVEITLKKDFAEERNEPIFEKAETSASIDQQDWRKFLEENTQPLVEQISKKAPSGKYTINVRFIVNKDGSLSDFKALNDPGYGIAEKILQMMQKAPKWKPAVQNGHVVRSYHTQPITFVIENGKPVPSNNTLPLYNPEDVKSLSFHQLAGVPESDEILSCTLAMDNQQGDIIVVTNNGNTFSERARELLQTAQKNRLLTIENIRVKRAGREYKVPSKIYAM